MAYQPISMPGLQIPDFASTILAARAQQRQQEADRWAVLRDQGIAARQAQELDMRRQLQAQQIEHQQFEEQRQRTADQEALRTKLQGLWDSGLGHQANQLAQLHGLTAAQQANTMQQPGAAPQTPDALAQARAEQFPENISEFVGPVTEESAGRSALDRYYTEHGVPGIDDGASVEGARAGMERGVNVAQQVMAARQAREQEPELRAADEAAFPTQMRDYNAQIAAYRTREANPVVSYSGPGGSFSVDPLERRQAEQADHARRADMLLEAFGRVPSMAPFAETGAALVRAGEDIKPGDVLGMAKADAAAKAKAEQDETYRPTVEMQDRWHRMSAAAAQARAANEKKDDKLDLQNETQLDGIVQKVIQNSSYKERRVDDQKFNQMATVFAGAKDNAALAAAGAGMWVKQAQGGVGTISDSDMKQFWGRIGGIPDRAEDYVSNALQGKMGEQKRQIVAAAVKELAQSAKKGLNDIGRAIESRLAPIAKNAPLAGERIQTYLDVYAPGLKRRASKDTLSAEDKQAVEWAEQNRGQPEADAILELHGM